MDKQVYTDDSATRAMKFEIYSDGACSGNPGPGGIGYVILNQGREYESGYAGYRRTTNNRMEILAVAKALMALWRKNALVTEITVYTDSNIVYGTMANGFKKKANNDIWNNLDEVISMFRGAAITFKKVDGHSGVTWNELADRLAVTGRDSRFKDIDSVYEREHPSNPSDVIGSLFGDLKDDQRTETLALLYGKLTDEEKDAFLHKTGNR